MASNDERWRTTTFDLPPDLDDDIEEFLENSMVFENRSQLYRASIRTFIAEEGDEFSEAR